MLFRHAIIREEYRVKEYMELYGLALGMEINIEKLYISYHGILKIIEREIYQRIPL
jgi:hypothetical protein